MAGLVPVIRAFGFQDVDARDERRHDGNWVCENGGKPMSSTATLKIRRGGASDKARWDTFEVPFEAGQSVLDGLRWLRVHQDPSIAVRFSCINANACKECMIQLDGETVYACTARLEPREMTLSPLPNKRLIRDLVTEIAPPSERFR
jgi:succinate dehydrogenase/fumarate reductase-like Fe-S protein